MRKILLAAALILVFCFGPGCSKPKKASPTPLPEVSIAVARFTQPRSMDDLLAGIMFSEQPFVGNKVLLELDKNMQKTLTQSSDRKFINIASSYSCQVKTAKISKKEKTALDYWIQVGACLDADMILVPQVTEWRELEGSGIGAETPASVTMDFYLIDVKRQQLAGRYHFEETQQHLTDNLLNINKFVKRGGKWVDAQTLASEGMRQAVEELGL